MFAILQAAGWPAYLILAASIVAIALIVARALALRASIVAPDHLLNQALKQYQEHGANKEMLTKLYANSPLGQILATGLKQARSDRDVMKEAIEESGRAVLHQLEFGLTTLGTIATIAPLLGLLGTVIGMIEIFGAQGAVGGGNPAVLAHGISIALYNTAFGIVVAIPAMIFYRHFRNKVDGLLIDMEQQAIKLVDLLQHQRQG